MVYDNHFTKQNQNLKLALRCIACISLAASLLTSCNTFTPHAVKSGRFDYNEAVQDSTNDQLLLNLVRLANHEPQLMLEIDQINVKYEIAYNAGINASNNSGKSVGRSIATGISGLTSATDATLNNNADGQRGSTDSEGVSGSASVDYSESPTVTYKPLQGEEYAKRLLEGIDFQGILELTQSLRDIDTVFRLAIEQVNSARNLPSDFAEKSLELPPSYSAQCANNYAAFSQFLAALDLLDNYGAVKLEYKDSELAKQKSIEISTQRDGNPAKESWTEPVSPTLPAATFLAIDIRSLGDAQRKDCAEAWKTVCSVLAPGSDPKGTEVLEAIQLSELGTRGSNAIVNKVSTEYGIPQNSVTLRSGRSLLGILQFVSQCVETPERLTQDIQVPGRNGLIRIQEQQVPYSADAPYFFRVESSMHKPIGAFAAARYKNRWYYIRNEDVRSKKVFSVVSNLIQLRSAEVNTGGTLRVIPL